MRDSPNRTMRKLQRDLSRFQEITIGYDLSIQGHFERSVFLSIWVNASLQDILTSVISRLMTFRLDII